MYVSPTIRQKDTNEYDSIVILPVAGTDVPVLIKLMPIGCFVVLGLDSHEAEVRFINWVNKVAG